MELAKEIKDACINIGFFYIKNHGIPEEIIAPVFSRVADFFLLTEETKMKLPQQKGNSASLLRVVHYPPQSPTAVDPAVGIGAHTDFRVFTILLQQPEIQALQVRNSKQEWINAPPIPGTLLIKHAMIYLSKTALLTVYYLVSATNWHTGRFKSTMHRVTNRSGADRYSVPLFFGVNDDVVLEPIPSCVSAENPRKYETITAGEYIKERRRAAYA
ncbi:isopenicillin N synthase [Mycena rebaudengoi]|nr:isopenicillin N synthase [Mycena rebaudengoi]